MSNKWKAGLLAGVIAGSVMIVGCHSKNKDDVVLPTEEATITEVSNEDLTTALVFSEDGETYLGEMEVNPNIYDILFSHGYSLVDNPDISRETLDSYQFEEFQNSIGVTSTDVNFRNGPSTDYDIMDSFYPNTPISLVARCENGWYLVAKEGRLGFIRGDYIDQVSEENLTTQLSQLSEVVPVVCAITNVNVRPDPSTTYTEYGTLPCGSYLEMLEKLDNGWYKVRYEDKIGYVCGDYVREQCAFSGENLPIVTMHTNANLYSSPYGDKIGSIPTYEIARVGGEVGGYYYVESNGQIGFVEKGDCTTLQGVYVIVDISEQKVTLYQNGEVLLVTDVVTGKDSTPTDLGLFSLQAKTEDTYLTGEDYSVHVNYWMPYNGGEGLHDATWRSSFGGQIYHNSGSHGCDNLPLDAARTIYENIEVGDKVLVKN